jgi:hypothetical protein
LAKVNNKKQAINCLKKAIDLNKDIKKIASEEEDFKSIRNDEEFKALINE